MLFRYGRLGDHTTGIARGGAASEKYSQAKSSSSASMTGSHATAVVVWISLAKKNHPVLRATSDLQAASYWRTLAFSLNDLRNLALLNIIFTLPDVRGLTCSTLKDLRAIATNTSAMARFKISTAISVAHRLIPSSANMPGFSRRSEKHFW